MLQLSINTYLQWRQDFLAEPTGRITRPRRGTCITHSPICVSDVVQPNLHLNNRAIEDAEFDLLWSGTINELCRTKLYADDTELLNAYTSLHLQDLQNTNPDSRNVVSSNKICCLAWFQKCGSTLTVLSRSMDLKTAGKSDIVLCNRIAQSLGCTSLRIIILNPHVYTNPGIARRP